MRFKVEVMRGKGSQVKNKIARSGKKCGAFLLWVGEGKRIKSAVDTERPTGVEVETGRLRLLRVGKILQWIATKNQVDQSVIHEKVSG